MGISSLSGSSSAGRAGSTSTATTSLYVADHQSNAKNNPGVRPGIRIGSAKDGKVTVFIPALGPEEKPTSTTEGIVVDAAGNLYAGETGTRNLRKYVKK